MSMYLFNFKLKCHNRDVPFDREMIDRDLAVMYKSVISNWTSKDAEKYCLFNENTDFARIAMATILIHFLQGPFAGVFGL